MHELTLNATRLYLWYGASAVQCVPKFSPRPWQTLACEAGLGPRWIFKFRSTRVVREKTSSALLVTSRWVGLLYVCLSPVLPAEHRWEKDGKTRGLLKSIAPKSTRTLIFRPETASGPLGTLIKGPRIRRFTVWMFAVWNIVSTMSRHCLRDAANHCFVLIPLTLGDRLRNHDSGGSMNLARLRIVPSRCGWACTVVRD